jgi:hypothetical protein
VTEAAPTFSSLLPAVRRPSARHFGPVLAPTREAPARAYDETQTQPEPRGLQPGRRPDIGLPISVLLRVQSAGTLDRARQRRGLRNRPTFRTGDGRFVQIEKTRATARIVLAVGKDRERRLSFLLLLLDLRQNCLREPSLQNSSKDVPRSQDYSGNTIPRLIDDDLSTEAYGDRGRRV